MRLKVGQKSRQIPFLGDHRTGGGAKIDPQFFSHNLRQRGFAQTRRPEQQDVVESFLRDLAASTNTAKFSRT